ncbi:MAG TPA: hypothetical protein VM070_01045 [Candidatus Saccharimonadales bacterium]|nr:hypothetical protein [Candidatus Saccharimonadales bacterium]
MPRSPERGGALVKALLAFLGLAGLGASGFGIWWLATEGDRVLERFAADTSSYIDITFKVDSKGNRSDKVSTTRKFSDLATTTLKAIR